MVRLSRPGNFGNNGDGTNQGWTVTAGFFANEGNGIEPAQANGNRAHDAAKPVAVLTSPTINFANVSGTDAVIDILWEGGQGNQSGSAKPGQSRRGHRLQRRQHEQHRSEGDGLPQPEHRCL